MVNSLEIDSVIKKYSGKLILSNVYLSAETGQIVGILGRNGSGKSTLLKILYGIESAENSFISLNGLKIDKPFKAKNLVSFSSQEMFLPKHLFVKEVLKIFFEGKIPEPLESRFKLVLSTRVGNLSGGEQKLLQLYSILNIECKFTILDEPFNHLSPIMVNEMKELIQEKARHKGIIITDHLYQDVLDLAKKVYFPWGRRIKTDI